MANLGRRFPRFLGPVAVVLLCLLPLPLNNYLRAVLWQIGIYVLLGLSLHIIVGYAGMFQLGHAAFYAIGAYTVGIRNYSGSQKSESRSQNEDAPRRDLSTSLCGKRLTGWSFEPLVRHGHSSDPVTTQVASRGGMPPEVTGRLPGAVGWIGETGVANRLGLAATRNRRWV